MDSKAIIVCNTAPFVRLVIQMFEFASQTSISAGYYKCRVIRSLFEGHPPLQVKGAAWPQRNSVV